MDHRQHAARTAKISLFVAYAIVLIGAVLTYRVSWFFAAFIVVMVLALQSRQIFFGYIPLRFPGFDDQVKGLMLGGMSEEAATAQVAQGETFRAIFLAALSALLTVMVCLLAYNIHLLPYSRVAGFLGRAALWIVGIGFVGVIAPFVVLGYGLATKSIKKG